MEPSFSPFSLPLHAPTPRPVYPVSAPSSPGIAPPLRSMSVQPSSLVYFPFSTESSILLLPEASHPRQYWPQNKAHERKVWLLARDMGYDHDFLPFLPDEPRYAPANAPRRPISRAEQRTPRPHSDVAPPRTLSSSYPTRHTHVPLSPRHAYTAPPRAASPLSAGVRPGAARQHPQGPRSPQRSPQLRLSSIQRPTSPRFHRPVSPTLPDLSPDTPEKYRHSIVSLPSPSPSQPGSPATAKDSLKGILGWNGDEDDEGAERYGDVWRGVVERRRWDQQGRQYYKNLPKPATAPRPCLLPYPVPRHPNHSLSHQPKHPSSDLYSLLPPMTPSSPLPPKPPSPILKAPPTSPVLAPLPQRFDVERVYESLRSAKGGGQVWFDEVEGVGSPTVEEEEEEEVEKVGELKAQETKKRKNFPW
ncbi:hypothetical protein L202_01528 [Cryptococcus amylolentus CBS 6039]|uniref:Uncharacterized protein n=2 Tax=Cryptococcus amylolentus TaxID=104669 RepID=A0A1E3I422_9TREE|nr:hypothetical protein L202_01528 [Cryptococcus amylolentus CBS 6039]ODN83384.1 hypothetical protein L202_01528 [Cryptococcus amylolentus CBS 6039]ODO10913.1 hypothetical protein I350_01512 [Cryptococcus amylolentus CBS 6273]